MSWLGQQTGQVFFSNASGMPFAAAPGPASGPVKMAAYHGMVNRGTPPFVLLPSSEQSQLTIPPTGKFSLNQSLASSIDKNDVTHILIVFDPLSHSVMQ